MKAQGFIFRWLAVGATGLLLAVEAPGYGGGSMGGGGAVTPTNQWIAGGSDLWQSNADWSLGSLPVSTQQVIIANAGTKTITIDATTTAGFAGNLNMLGLSLSAPGGDVTTLWLNNSGLMTALSAGTFAIGQGGALQVSTGVVYVSNNFSINSGSAVFDTGSARATYIFVGETGAGGSLVASNGSQLNANLYLGSQAAAVNNSVLIRGSNTVWSGGTTQVGAQGGFNRLTIGGGGKLLDGNGYVGLASSASNNTVLVTDAGSVWSNSSDMYMGSSGAGNQLLISTGANVFANNAYLGYSGNNNTAQVAGAGALWSMQGEVKVGAASAGNLLAVSGGGQLVSGNGYLGYYAGGSNNLALVSDAASSWNYSGSLTVGYYGSGNQLVVSNGAQATGYGGVIGLDANANNNSALVSGGGSAWTNLGDVYVGNGVGNQLTVANGGKMFVSGSTYVGALTSASNNVVQVGGAQAVLVSQLNFYVGEFGSGNQLLVGAGGCVSNNYGFIGYASGANNNSALISGSHALWQNLGDLNIGNGGTGNQLTIGNGGRVLNNNGYVGSLDSNAVYVTGVNSFWGNQANVYVGNSGTGNQLLMDSGAQVNVGGHLYVGNFGAGSVLGIADATLMVSSNSYIGWDTSAVSNRVWVSGGSTMWNTLELRLGYLSAGNQLTVSNGATVQSTAGYVGNGWQAHDNVALVTGANSAWQNSGDFFVGNNGSSNQLVVAAGGSVGSANSYLGYNPGANFNTALVTGSNSSWNTGGNLVIGYYGTNNQLTIAAGASVNSVNAYLGFKNLANNNTVLVTDNGSVWNNNDSLQIGYNGWGALLTVSNGGTVSSGRLVVGSNGVGGVVVDGGQLVATAAPSIIGDSGNGSLTVHAGLARFAALALGNQGIGGLAQDGGTVDVLGPLTFADGVAGYGMASLTGGQLLATNGLTTLGRLGWTVMNVDGGLLRAQDVRVGASSSGSSGFGSFLNINSGSCFVAGTLDAGHDSAGLGTIKLNGGALVAANEIIGNSGTGWFTQGDALLGGNGLNSVGSLVVGANAASSGNYTLNAGTLSATSETVGDSGTGWFQQTGGTNTVNNLTLGASAGGAGIYLLSGGALVASNEFIGGSGVGQFSQSGGTNTIWGTLNIGSGAGGFGYYELDSGKISAGNINIQANGVLTNLGGNVDCVVLNLGTFVHAGGDFNAQLINQGTFLMTTNFAPSEGVVNYTSMTIPTNLTLSANGAGFDNKGVLALAGGTLAGSGALVNTGTVSGFGAINNQIGNAGTLEATNGTLTLSGALANRLGGVLKADGGSTLKITTGLASNAGWINLNGGTLDNSGHGLTNANTIAGNGTILADVVNDATLAPGHSPGLLVINGGLELRSSSLVTMELAGNTTNLYDRILVSGNLQLGGALQVLTLNGFAPAAGDSFELFDFGAVSGSFSSTDLPTLGAGLTWDASQLDNNGLLSVVAIPEPVTLGMFLLTFGLLYQWRKRR